ncbi:ankyrin, partial [Melanomma pulvis-pyrius CBS 109.77]
DRPDILGRSPLHIACHKGRESIAKVLLDIGADVGRRTVFGSLPLHYAAASGSLAACKALLAVPGINANALDNWGSTALFWAVRNKKSEIVRFLLSLDMVDPNAYNKDIECMPPPLIEAICQGNELVVQYFLDAGADVNNKFGRTPLICAAMDDFTQGVKFLVGRKEVDVNSRDDHGRTALMFAAEWGCISVVEELLKCPDTHVSATDDLGQTALDLAHEKSNEAIVEAI